ncbi:hypothetical protein CPC08DRAFT_268277 [Agrocybe pediades]|nr:hypothetical protein CPC08DRAFT_268277 [Agrocybe pediades]
MLRRRNARKPGRNPQSSTPTQEPRKVELESCWTSIFPSPPPSYPLDERLHGTEDPTARAVDGLGFNSIRVNLSSEPSLVSATIDHANMGLVTTIQTGRCSSTLLRARLWSLWRSRRSGKKRSMTVMREVKHLHQWLGQALHAFKQLTHEIHDYRIASYCPAFLTGSCQSVITRSRLSRTMKK